MMEIIVAFRNSANTPTKVPPPPPPHHVPEGLGEFPVP